MDSDYKAFVYITEGRSSITDRGQDPQINLDIDVG